MRPHDWHIAIHLAPGLHGRGGDKLPEHASIGGAWRGSLSKRDLHFFKELHPLLIPWFPWKAGI